VTRRFSNPSSAGGSVLRLRLYAMLNEVRLDLLEKIKSVDKEHTDAKKATVHLLPNG
jgi:hypothetical protein